MPLPADDLALVDESLGLLADSADQVVAHFYASLFLRAPELRRLFPVVMTDQRDRFFGALRASLRGLAAGDEVLVILAGLGAEHRRFGVRPEHYPVFGEALVTTVRRHCGDLWVPELETAWTRVYAAISGAMIEGAREAALRGPAWWRAEIVEHQRRTADLAVLRLRTDRPYPYRAGQFTRVETPYRPGSWRPFSLATAPTDDDQLLELHVRAVPAGWVSGPLVSQARVGDRLRLGPPAGTLHLDPSSGRDVLCVAGGTGMAPIRALVEDLAARPGPGSAMTVTVLVGARRPDDLYDLPALSQLATGTSWLRVVPVVAEGRVSGGVAPASASDGDAAAGRTGLLPDVLERLGDWRRHDVVVSGPPTMTTATVARLEALGVPRAQVSHDPMLVGHPLGRVIDLRRSAGLRATRAGRHG